MPKEQLKHYLQLYPKIKNEIIKGRLLIEWRQYGRKKREIIPNWVLTLREYIEETLLSESEPLVVQAIQMSFIEGESDIFIFSRLPISESTFYRWKTKFVEKIYRLYIVAGYVSREEILQEVII